MSSASYPCQRYDRKILFLSPFLIVVHFREAAKKSLKIPRIVKYCSVYIFDCLW